MMAETSQWSYVIAAYALTAAATAVVFIASWRAMRDAERRAADLAQDDRS